MSQGLTSPSVVPRPATRRRETTDTNPFSPGALISPTSAGPSRLDMSWLGRKGSDNKDEEAQYDDKLSAVPDSATRPGGFAGLARSNTAGTPGFPGSSVWGASTTTPTASAFNAFGNFALNTPVIADKGFASSTASSRFFSKKDGPENTGSGAGPSTGASNMANSANQSWRSRQRTDTDPFGGDEGGLSGSAALGGARDTSPPPMPTTHGSQIFDTPAKGNTSDFGMSGLNLSGARERNASSASPSQTNPYRSPPAERGDNDHEDLGFDKGHALGGTSEQNSNFGSMRGFPGAAAAAFEGSDRSQTSSVGAKNYPPLGNIGGWASAFATATPDRERAGFGNAFGNSVFSPMSELQSPGLNAMGSLFGQPSSSGLGGAMRGGSKLGSLFPPAMQAQMQTQEHDPLTDSVPDLRQSNPLSAIGAGAIGAQSRDTDSPLPIGRGGPMDMFSSAQSQVHTPSLFSTAEHNQPLLANAPQPQGFGTPAQGPPFGSDQAAGGPPQSQRIMVMPDRMRWIYMDPQGTQQGPFTGLEMNEWYKGNFFTNDLRVRKLEDPEFEPLGQLIRRIGNSREPFLVPQVGVPHGQPAQSGPFSAGGDSRGVIPPLTGLVPSYGKTLTAEEQNNLERRKQEEQVALARQREFMAQQSHFRNIHPGVPGALQHQASMHSLQSQPSFGSITSPIGMPSQGPIGAVIGGGPMPGFFDQATAAHKGPGLPNAMNAGPDHLRGDLYEHERQNMASLHGPGGVSGMFPPQPVGPPTADLKSQLPSLDQLEGDSQGFKERLKEFQEYQGIPTEHRTDEEALPGPSQIVQAKEQGNLAAADTRSDAATVATDEEPGHQQQQQPPPPPAVKKVEQPPHLMSLTQQVQKAQADAAQAAHHKAQEAEAWARQSAATGLPMPFPAPLPSTNVPLPAPTAQRRSNIADQYNETRSQSQTPDSAAATSATAAQPPPLAPWAREPGTETQKGPSMKEIQEAEAHERTVKEEARRRRAAQEQVAMVAKERENMSQVAPGLPPNSTWGSGSPAPAASDPWSKPANAKPGVVGGGVAGNTTPAKRPLAEIQREEIERQKQRQTKEASLMGPATGTHGMGKRYADLASKSGPPGISTAASAAGAASSAVGGWSTVGAGGKVKAPVGPQTRSASASTVRSPAPQAAQQPAKPVVPAATKVNSIGDAHAALQKWLKGELSRGMKATDKVEQVANTLLEMNTTDKEIVELIFYEWLSTDSAVDPRGLALEYIRRKKQADKGIFEPAPVSDPKSSGGWSEVAKKGSSSSQAKDADVVGAAAAGFKVVPRKKGKK